MYEKIEKVRSESTLKRMPRVPEKIAEAHSSEEEEEDLKNVSKRLSGSRGILERAWLNARHFSSFVGAVGRRPNSISKDKPLSSQEKKRGSISPPGFYANTYSSRMKKRGKVLPRELLNSSLSKERSSALLRHGEKAEFLWEA